MSEYMPYEGAGFILSYQDNIILGLRHKKAADAIKDPIQEVEYMGGKPEPEDGNDPLQTAYAELIEETGGLILDDGWRDRVCVIHVFQPFSKKWIWCCLLTLNKEEYSRLENNAISLHNQQFRPFQQWTGRRNSVTCALDDIYTCHVSEVSRYMDGFAKVPVSENRLLEAKEYRKHDKLQVKNLRTGVIEAYPLRAFNTVMWEHIDKIVQ